MTTPKFQVSSAPAAAAAEYLVQMLKAKLTAHTQVLWFVAGGSSIAVAASVIKKLSTEETVRLTVALTDERYGEVGHKDSNALQLEQAGFMLPGLTVKTILVGENLEKTVARYEGVLQEILPKFECIVGLFGIGPDGHAGGILPHSPGTEASGLATGYDAGAFVRVSITFKVMGMFEEIVLFASGETKKEALTHLKEDLSFVEEPAQALKQAKKLTVFTDQVV